MNIFLDKSLPKKTQILLQILRVVLLAILFGGIFYASINPSAEDLLLYVSIALAVLFLAVKIILERRRKKLVVEEQPNNISTVQGSDTTKMS
jgi:drug/metabolite transporter (DMT)-like permease